jgi:capsular exopolysaccharide synthesis family protein
MDGQAGQYTRLLKQWWWLLVISLILPAVATNFLLSRQADTYQARVTLMIGSSLQNPEPDLRQLNVANTLVNAYARLAKEGPVLQAVIDRLALDREPDQLAMQVGTAVYGDAQLLEIRVVDANPRAAALIANALADELVRRSPISQEDQAQRQAFIRSQLDDLQERIERADEKLTGLQASIVDLTSAAELAEAQNRISQMETVKADLQATYASLMESYRTDAPNIVSVFDPAVEPVTPLPRRDIMITGVAAVAGLALSVGGVLLIEYVDDTVRWEEDTKQSLLGLPVLGAIPRLPIRKGSVTETFEPLSHSAEMVRALRTNVLLAAGDRPLKTLLLTSPTLKDGKTLAVAQLGLAMAAAGRCVVMVDADLRKPALHEMFDLPNLYGLSELLAGRSRFTGSAWPRGTQDAGIKNLYLLPGGKPPVDPTLLLTSPRLGKLFEALGRQADVILIDSPPESVAPDAAVLASAADGTILIVSAGATGRRKISRTKEHLAGRDGVNLLGVTFNRVKVNGNGYYYAHSSKPQRRVRRLWRGLRARLPFIKEGTGEEKPVVLNLTEMSHRLGVGRRTARRWCKDGQLPAFKSWLRWRIKEGDLEEAMHRLVRDPDA